jgi:hypothetical protein
LLREDGAAIEEWWSEVVDQQMNSGCFFIVGPEIVAIVSPLRDTGCEHTIGFPIVNVFALGITE